VLAILSDVHANLAALEAVLQDIEQQGVNRIVCLGDIVGYGPEPKECIDLAFGFEVTILGNHEQALMEQFRGSNFNERAKGSLSWTRQCLSMLGEDREANARRWDFLGALPVSHTDGDILYVHGTPRRPVDEYLYPRDVLYRERLHEIFGCMGGLCFNGHTHIPGIWTEDVKYLSPKDVNFTYRLTREKTIVNVGSVGQPRDGDARACYVIFDGHSVVFRRVAYPVERTVGKMKRIASLDPFLAERLFKGR